jgi:transcriptional regulator with XRE-family HTH domain
MPFNRDPESKAAGAESSSWERRSLAELAGRTHDGGMQREQLADFLRRRREAIRPGEVGIADGPRRRIAGLRREEVAMLAGMSVDYVVRLEQGRSSQPSTQLLGSLARALRLSDDERDHLFHLAGHQPPAAEGPSLQARAGLLRMLDLLGDTPAIVFSDLGECLAQNRAAVLLMGVQTGFTGWRRFLTYRWFTEPGFRPNPDPAEQEQRSRELVADLRAVAGRRADDPLVAGLIKRLLTESPDFARLWSEHEVAVRRADRKTFEHPRVGPLLMDCETLTQPDQLQKLLVLSPADEETRERMHLLRVLGIEEFPTDVYLGQQKSPERPVSGDFG